MLAKKIALLAGCIQHVPAFWLKKIRKPNLSKINLVMIDMDGTFTNFHTFKNALSNAYNDQNKEYQKVIYTAKNDPKLTVDNNRLILGLHALIKGGFNHDFEKKLLKQAKEEVNLDILNFIKKIKGAEIIIVSRSSEWIASELSKKFNLSGGYGSKMTYDKKGNLIGAKYLVTDKIPANHTNYVFTTKEMLAKKHMLKAGKEFSLQRTMFFTNDILDAKVMSECACGILVKEKNLDLIDNIAVWLGLYDYFLQSSEDYTRLTKLLNAKITTQS